MLGLSSRPERVCLSFLELVDVDCLFASSNDDSVVIPEGNRKRAVRHKEAAHRKNFAELERTSGLIVGSFRPQATLSTDCYAAYLPDQALAQWMLCSRELHSANVRLRQQRADSARVRGLKVRALLALQWADAAALLCSHLSG